MFTALDAQAGGASDASPTTPSGYALEFVSTAATGTAMNDNGDVVGTSYVDTGCGPWCLPPQETVVWRRGGARIVLPQVAGFSGITVRGINVQGWVVGFAGVPGTTTHAVLWKPNGGAYTATDLGVLPGTTSSEAVGIDDQGRVIGWSNTLTYPPVAAPFMWMESSGMVDLAAQGYPAEKPLAISGGGTVATPGFWYVLGNVGSVTAMQAPPPGFYPPGTYATAVNDVGDQARFLVSTGPQNLAYLFRYHHVGAWQQLSTAGNGSMLPFGVGSISSGGDVTATLLGSAVVAYGPSGLAQPLAALLSTAYQGSAVEIGGPMNRTGRILAQVMIGRSSRLGRLVPIQPCTVGCLRVGSLQFRAAFIEDPTHPGQCLENGNAYNTAVAKLVVTDDAGARLSGVLVRGRILDDYWTNAPVSGTTDANGEVTFTYRGQCGVGALAILIDGARKGLLSFDRSQGILTRYAIPRPPLGTFTVFLGRGERSQVAPTKYARSL